MNVVILVFGVLLVSTGFVTLIRKLHDRTIHETLAELRNARGDAARAISAFAGLFVPIVSAIASGVAFLAVGALGQSAGPLSWLGL
jgi:hypothetical protein